ncbi:cytochrome c oxidase assembly protein CtaG/Cox11 domain-containing protein [Trichoderma sp. TUCIM 5745]
MSLSVNRYSRKKVAIVGSGCSGIAALWALNRTYHDVYLYEAADRLGGHTNTVQWKAGKYTTDVDTGFIVLNTATYPNFLNFLSRVGKPAVGVATEPTEMTFSVSRDRGLFEWASTSLGTIFCQKRNLFSPRMWRTLFDIVRFSQFALDLLIDEEEYEPRYGGEHMMNHVHKTLTIGEYLEREGYSDGFRDDYLIPMTAAIWSASPDKGALEFPATTLVRFLWNHHLLSAIALRPKWLTLKNGARSYIDAVMKGFPSNHLFLKTAVKNVSNDSHGRVLLHLENGKTEVYDHVILATHGDQALSILGSSATEQERSILYRNAARMNNALRLMRTSPPRTASSSPQWACFFCQNARPQNRRPNFAEFRRNLSISRPRREPQTPPRQQATGAYMDNIRAQYNQKNKTSTYWTLSAIIGFFGLAYGAVPLYKMICQTTGWGGTPIRAYGLGGDEGEDLSTRLVPVTSAKRIKVTFNAAVSDVLPWKFVPQQREVRVLPGETALAFYKATNLGDKDIIGVATYSVTPAQCAGYFSKIQCFCFEEQRLNAGETVDMPVFFYLDPDLLNDVNMKGVETVTLNYTFFSKFLRHFDSSPSISRY